MGFNSGFKGLITLSNKPLRAQLSITEMPFVSHSVHTIWYVAQEAFVSLRIQSPGCYDVSAGQELPTFR